MGTVATDLGLPLFVAPKSIILKKSAKALIKLNRPKTYMICVTQVRVQCFGGTIVSFDDSSLLVVFVNKTNVCVRYMYAHLSSF